MARVLIGTSGWHYESWRGSFFPEGLPLKDQLRYYSGQFETTELNGVFYRTPTPEFVARADQSRFRLLLESVQVHHTLEASVRSL
jgi:uncharacterized protein YecE (DUF72 family)